MRQQLPRAEAVGDHRGVNCSFPNRISRRPCHPSENFGQVPRGCVSASVYGLLLVCFPLSEPPDLPVFLLRQTASVVPVCPGLLPFFRFLPIHRFFYHASYPFSCTFSSFRQDTWENSSALFSMARRYFSSNSAGIMLSCI